MIDIFCTLKKKDEPPQIFFMRVAMGLAINEVDREEKAMSFTMYCQILIL